jgi:hypothetical protein
VLKYEAEQDLQRGLDRHGIRCFVLSSSCGMDGFVLATAMTKYALQLTTSAEGPNVRESGGNVRG